MKNRHQTNSKLIMVVLATVLISCILLVFGGYYFGKNHQQNVQPLPIGDTNNGTATYVDEKNRFAFNYPKNLKPLEQPNGVVLFLPIEVYDACKSAQKIASKVETSIDDFDAYLPCYQANFILNGFTYNSTRSYEAFVQEQGGYIPGQSYADSQGRIWQIHIILGEVYNFAAFSSIGNNKFEIHFQYNSKSIRQEEEIISFFSPILSSFKYLGETNP